MARQQRPASPPTESLELRPQASCPRISVSEVSSASCPASSSPSPAPSQTSTGQASTPTSQNASGAHTPASSVYDPNEAIETARRFWASINTSLHRQGNTALSPPQSPNSTGNGGAASQAATTTPCLPTDSTSGSSLPTLKRIALGNGTQQFLGLGVCALTIVTVVYSHRADRNQRWENGLNFYQACAKSNFTIEGCDNYRAADLTAPPYDPWKMFIWTDRRAFVETRPRRESKRSAETLQPNDETMMPAAQARFWTLASVLIMALALFAWAIFLSVKARRSKQIKLSAQSMARRDIPQATTPMTSKAGFGGESGGTRRLKAYVTAETAIKRLNAVKSDDSTSRRGSMPWRGRGLDPSIFKDAEIHHGKTLPYDVESTASGRVEPYRSSVSTSTSKSESTLSLRKVYTQSQSDLASLRPRTREEQKLQQVHPLRKMFLPSKIVVSNQPLSDLEEGDIKGALALMGAATAATGGGTAMRMCPVEVPVSKHHLPEGWMPISSQDVSCSAT